MAAVAAGSRGSRVMRVVTLLWVCLSNLTFAWILLSNLFDERTLHRLLESSMPWKEFLGPVSIVAILLVGVTLEIADAPAAFFVNAGSLVLTMAYAGLFLLEGRQDIGSRTFGLLLGVPCFSVLIIDILLYTAKKPLKEVEPPL
jgi:ABC-type multidrug transport system fused ATPase/permease subunit